MTVGETIRILQKYPSHMKIMQEYDDILCNLEDISLRETKAVYDEIIGHSFEDEDSRLMHGQYRFDCLVLE